MGQELSSEQKTKIKEEFDNIDANGDHYLSKDEVCERIRENAPYLKEETVQSLMEGYFKNIDTNKDGKISQKEYMTYLIKTQKDA